MSEELYGMEGGPEGPPSPALPAAGAPESSGGYAEAQSPDWESFVEGAALPRGAPPKTKSRRLTLPEVLPPPQVSPQRRRLILDTWRRSGLPAADFAVLVGVSKHTLYAWKKRFEEEGPGGLLDRPRGSVKGSKLPDLTKRAILMMKEANPDWGCQRISDMLVRGPALPASPSAVLRVLHDAGYQLEETPTKPHPDKVRRFERARPSELWQTDLFTFVLKRQNRRVYLVAFMDDHSRSITGYGLHASQSAALVLEVLRAAITSYGNPAEILTDNRTQYVTWRGSWKREGCDTSWLRLVVRRRWERSSGSEGRSGGSAWRPRCSWTCRKLRPSRPRRR